MPQQHCQDIPLHCGAPQAATVTCSNPRLTCRGHEAPPALPLTEDADIFELLVLNVLDDDLLVRLQLQQLEDEAQELARLARAAKGAAGGAQPHRLRPQEAKKQVSNIYSKG